MEEIQEQLERLIDDIERDSQMTKSEIILALYKLKEEIEDYNLKREEVKITAKKILKDEGDDISELSAYVMAYHEWIKEWNKF